MEKTKVLILGTNSYADVIVDMFECCQDMEFVGLVENLAKDRVNSNFNDLPVHWNGDLGDLVKSHKLTCSIGSTLRKDWIEEKETEGFKFAQLLHPSSTISQKTTLNDGVIIDAGVVISSFTKIAKHVRIGRSACIGHHTEIGPFTTIHPGAIVSGNCTIGSQVTIGTGAVIIDNKKIGDGAFIAAGAIVIDNVPEGVLMGGNPAKVLRKALGPK